MDTTLEKEEKLKPPGIREKAVAQAVAQFDKFPRNDAVVAIILLIRRNLRLLASVGIISFCCSYYYFGFYRITYRSSITFLIDETNPGEVTTSEPERLVLSQLVALNRNRLEVLAYSDEMVRRLDQQIGIGQHYGMDKSQPLYIKNLVLVIREMVNVKRELMNIVVIEARDDDKDFAALLANTIFDNLKVMNRETVNKNILYKLNVYDVNIHQYELKRKKEIEDFMIAIDKLPETNIAMMKKNEALFLKRDLSNILDEYNNTSFSMIKDQLIYDLTGDAIKDTSLQTLVLINKAYPSSSWWVSYLVYGGYSLIAALGMMAYVFFCIYFYREYKPYFRLLFAKRINFDNNRYRNKRL